MSYLSIYIIMEQASLLTNIMTFFGYTTLIYRLILHDITYTTYDNSFNRRTNSLLYNNPLLSRFSFHLNAGMFK